jgi:hypothetical protein
MRYSPKNAGILMTTSDLNHTILMNIGQQLFGVENLSTTTEESEFSLLGKYTGVNSA